MCDLVILLYKCTFLFLLNLGNTSAVVIQFLLVFGVQHIITKCFRFYKNVSFGAQTKSFVLS